MNILQDIIERCHQRHNARLRQRKTVVTPALYRSIPYHFKVHCTRGYTVTLAELEGANISFMPIGRAPENEHGPKDFGGDRFLKRQDRRDWNHNRWFASWGLQIYTGIPSELSGARWHDFDFKYEAICAAPDAVIACVDALIKITANPLLTLTRSGGLRFTCRIPDYLHPNTDAAKFYIYKHSPTPEDPYNRDVYLEILGEKGYSRWDARYEVLNGDLLEPPIITKELLFVPIDALRVALHAPGPSDVRSSKTEVVAPRTLGSNDLDLAKEAFLKRGFSYLQQDKDFHHWIYHDNEGENIYAWLWEDHGTVWVRASAPINGLLIRGMPITTIWDDTGITAPMVTTGIPVTEKMLAVREGKLSPLAIKRPPPSLTRQESTERSYATLEAHTAQIRRAFEVDARIIGVNAETVPETNYEIEHYLRSGGAICLNIPSRNLAEAAEQRYQSSELPSVARWRARLYRWEQVKDIPVDERMAHPFQHGNPCEDPVRCRALEYKGGDPQESICPGCAVYTECQQRGYLSQPLTLQRAKAQITPVDQLFFNPRQAASLEKILDPVDETERIYIIDKIRAKAQDLFLRCELRKSVLEGWAENWRGQALAQLAKALLNAFEPQGQPYDNPTSRVRATIHAFQQHEAELIRQMCHVNMRGKVVARGHTDAETGQALARFSVEFEGGASAYIPLNSNAEAGLRANGIPCLPIDAFSPNAEIEIPMSMTEAVALGILDTETVEKILAFPTVSRNPNWTFWHQLKSFFSHYKRDTDAPMLWSDEKLLFYVPPVLHPRVKRLMLMSPTLSEYYLRRAFPNEDIKFIRTAPTAWGPGNQVFQLRTGIYSLHTILNDDSIWNSADSICWDVPSLSKTGERFFFGIRAEIERDTSVKHALIANIPIIKLLADLTEKENFCFMKDFKEMDGSETNFEEVDVVWIIGTPHWPESTIWWHAQMLFGSDEEPLYYEGTSESAHYKDERVQSVYQQHIVGLLTRTIGQIGLNRWSGKKVILLTSVALPDITDRPETLLFDWEDFEVAGGIHKLPETIATRQRFETDYANLTGESKKEKVQRILGCSSRQAYRVLRRLRGGKPLRVSFREQILSLLANGEKRTAELMGSIDGHPKAIDNELRQLIEKGEIVRVRRGVYALPNSKDSNNA